jgi:hypothetical protein
MAPAGSGERVSLVDRPTGSGTTGMNRWCSKAMRGPLWTWTDFFKRSSKSSTRAWPASALLHGPSPLTASSYADLNDHAAADSSRAISSDRRCGYAAWALPRGGPARVSNSLCWCAVRCRRSHVKRRSKALLMRLMAPTWVLDVLIARTRHADRSRSEPPIPAVRSILS